MIRFPVEMGDVPLLKCISSSPMGPNVTETTQGIASGSKVAFEFDGQLTEYIDFINTNMTQASLRTMINNVFTIRCPPSINDARATPSITLVRDFESDCIYDDNPITDNAFCGQCSYMGNNLLYGNTGLGNYLCFAYRTSDIYLTTMTIYVKSNSDTSISVWAEIPFIPITDFAWHYTCLDIRAILVSRNSISSSASSLVIEHAWLNNKITNGLYVDAITTRTALPVGYEAMEIYPVDQSANNSCVFPFTYNGRSYSACTLDNNQMPICTDRLNNVYRCKVSSIEGVRRLYPAHQLLYNTLQVNYSTGGSNITIAFRYSDCFNPALIVASPSSVSISK